MSKGNFKLKFVQSAYDDLDEIYYYITEKLKAPYSAGNLIDKIEGRLLYLEEFPYCGEQITGIDYLRRKNYRRLIVDNFIIFYLVDDIKKNVIVMRILYGARDYIRLV